MKKIFDFFSDRKILLGIGIGLLLGALIMVVNVKPSKPISNLEIENRARGLGMDFPGDFKFK